MKTGILITASVYALAATFSGCSKDENTGGDVTNPAEDYELFEQIAGDADDMADEAFAGSGATLRTGDPASGNFVQGCASVTRDTVNHIITLDFGSGCTGLDGRVRSGQILITYNGHYFDPGFSRSLSFNNYFVDNNQVSGTRTILNNGINSNGHLAWSITAQNLRVTRPSGDYREWNSSRIREMIAGDSTPLWIFDDIYLITGSGSGSNSHGGACTFNITAPLNKIIACRWIVSGTVEISSTNHPTRILDYGNGQCDRQATVTVNGITHNIVLH